jgi:hypothetical protein
MTRDPESMISRRTLVHGLAAAAGATVVGASGALAQQGGQVGPPTTITTPPRDFGPGGAPTTYFWDPDIIAVDPSFNDIAQPNTAIKRLYTGLLWAEGPAWSAQGRYLVWSDNDAPWCYFGRTCQNASWHQACTSPCNAAGSGGNDDRSHHGCNQLATTFGARLPRRGRPQEARPQPGIRTRRMRSRLSCHQ